MMYTVTWLPKYKSKVQGKYDNWMMLNSSNIGFPAPYKLIVSNYRIIYK